MRLFVTGGTGFIGRALVSRLCGLGHEVGCLVRDAVPSDWLTGRPGLTLVRGNLLEPESYGAELRRAELVFHVAGLTKARTRAEYLRMNGEAAGMVARAAAAGGSGVKKIVHVSSLAVAGPRNAGRPAREDEPAAPITHYGESKLQGEELLRRHCGGIPWTVVRPPVVYGPFDRDVFRYFLAASKGFVPLLGAGRMELSLVHVEDLVSALLLAAFSKGADGRVYYCSDGAVHTTADIARALVAAAGGGRIIPVPDAVLRLAGWLGDLSASLTRKPALLNGQKIKEARQKGWVCSTDRIREELGFRPEVAMEDGFLTTYRWYREQGWM